MDGSMMQYPPGDPRLVDKIVCQLKSQGIFDRFRKECIADVDTKPAYQNLHQRVEGTVSAFLTNQEWRPELNKNQLRDSLRKHIHESGILDLGVERIVDQVVNPKILPVLLPQIEDVVYNFLGIEKPKTRYSQTVASLQTPKNFKPPKMETLEDLLPKDLDPISPGSVGVNSDDENSIDDVKNEVKDEHMEDDDKMCEDEDSSPPFEPIEKMPIHDESSLDSHISGISGLTSHDSQMSNLSYGKETQPPPEPVTPHKIPPIDLSNQDSQLSKVSSGSRLSIVFSDDVDRSDQKNSPFTSDMDIQNDDSGLSKNGGIIDFEYVAPPPPPANEDSNCAYDSNVQESPDERPLPYSPLEFVPDKQMEEQEPVFEAPGKIDDVKEEYPEIVKELDTDEKVIEDGEKEREIHEERKHFNTNSDSRDSRRSESTSHSSDSEHLKEEKEQIYKSKDYLKYDDNIDSKEISMLEDKQRKESEDIKIDEVEKLEKDVEDRDHFKLTLENRCEMTTRLDSSKECDKNVKDDDHKERDFTKEKLKFDERDLKEKVTIEDTEKVKSDKDCKEANKEKSDKESKDKNKEKSDKESKEPNKEKSDKESKEPNKEKSEKEYKKSHHDDKGKENLKDRNKEREIEREGSREKIEKETAKEKSRHDEKNRDSSRDKTKTSDKESSKEKQKVDVKIEKDNHKDKTKFDDKSRKDVSKDKARHDRSDKGSGRDSSRHKEQERSRSKNDGKEKKDEKSKDDKSRRNEKEASKDKLKKDVSDGTKNEEGDEKRNKSQSDQKREKERSSRETSRHADKSKSDKGKNEEKVKEVKSETKDVMAKHESKDSEKSVNKDSRSKTRTESKEKDDRNEKKESRKDERSRDNKSKEDRNERDKPKDDKKDKDKPKDDKVDRDRSRSDKEKSKEHKSEREKPKDEKEKDRSSRSSHNGKDGEMSKKSDRESSSKSRSSSSTSGASDKSRDSRKKEKEKSRSVPDDHSSHRDRNSDDRRSTDRDSNGAAHGQSASTRNEAPTSRRNGRSTADDGGSNSNSKSEGGGGGSGGGGNKSADTTAVTPTIKESTDARNSPSDESVAPSLPFKKRPVVSSPEPSEGVALDEYDCVNNAPGKLVLKLKKPRIAANIFEVRKIMHLRKSMAKNERKKQFAEDTAGDSGADEPSLKFFSDEEARPDAAFIKFVSDLENSETLYELASSDEEEMPKHLKAERAREDPSTSGETLTPLPSSLKVKTENPQESIEKLGRAKTEASSVKKESPVSSEPPRGKPSVVIPERREKRRKERDVRTRAAHLNDEGPVSPKVEAIPSPGEYLPRHISDVLGIDCSRSVNISKDPSPVSEEVSPVKNVTSTPSVSSVTRSSPTLTSSPVPRIRPPKRRAAGSPAPAVPDVLSVVTPKRLRNDISSVSDVVPSVVAVDLVKTVETTAPRIIYPSATTSRPSTLGLRKVTTTRSLSPGIINYGGYISKEIVEVKVLDADGDDEYSSSIKENNNVDKSSSDDEKGCGDDMSLSKELISSALRDLMMESGLNLGESPAAPTPTPAAASKEETAAEGAASATGRRGGVKAARGRRLGLARPTRRSGSGSLSPQTSGEFVLSPSRDRDAPEAKAVIPTSPSSSGRRRLPSSGQPVRAAAVVALPPPSATLLCCVLPRQQLLQQQQRRRRVSPRERVLVQARVRARARIPRWPAAVAAVNPQREPGANSGSRVPPRACGWRNFCPSLAPPSPRRLSSPAPWFPDFGRR